MLFLWSIFTLLPFVMSSFFCFVIVFFIFWRHTRSALVSECKTLSRESLKLSENISHGSMGLQIAWQEVPPCAASQTGISTFTYLQYLCVCCQFVLLYLSKNRKRLAILLYMLLFSLTKNTWPQRASPTVNHDALCSIYMLLLERELLLMWVYSKVTNCSLVCMYTFFVIEM